MAEGDGGGRWWWVSRLRARDATSEYAKARPRRVQGASKARPRRVHLRQGQGALLGIPTEDGRRCWQKWQKWRIAPHASCGKSDTWRAPRSSGEMRFSRCRHACWVGTLETSVSHAVWGCCFSVVSAADRAPPTERRSCAVPGGHSRRRSASARPSCRRNARSRRVAPAQRLAWVWDSSASGRRVSVS
jgi:hypothetical protein